jgi:hypothetical protein
MITIVVAILIAFLIMAVVKFLLPKSRVEWLAVVFLIFCLFVYYRASQTPAYVTPGTDTNVHIKEVPRQPTIPMEDTR